MSTKKLSSGSTRKYIAFFAIVIAVIAILVSYYFVYQPVTIKRQLVIYHLWTAGGEKEAISYLVNGFKEKYSDIELIENPTPRPYEPVVLAALSSDNPPDAFMWWTGNYLISLAKDGLLTPLDDMWYKYGYDKEIVEQLQPWVKYNGKIYGIPLTMHSMWLFYNKKVFDKYGLTPPKTWDELIEVCDKLKENGVWPIVTGGKDVWPVEALFSGLISSMYGSDIMLGLAQGKVKWTDEKVLNAFERFIKLKDYLHPSSYTLTWAQAADVLARGEAAMYYMGDWLHGYLKNIGLKPLEDYDFIPFPKGDPSAPSVVLLVSDVFVIPKNAKHIEEAKLWAAFIASAEAQEGFVKYKGCLSPNKDTPLTAYDDLQKKIYENIVNADQASLRLRFLLDHKIYSELAPRLVQMLQNPEKYKELAQEMDKITEEILGK